MLHSAIHVLTHLELRVVHKSNGGWSTSLYSHKQIHVYIHVHIHKIVYIVYMYMRDGWSADLPSNLSHELDPQFKGVEHDGAIATHLGEGADPHRYLCNDSQQT